MYQKVLLIGNVGRDDPILRYTADGTPVASFSMATNETWGSGDDKKQKTTWWKCSCWRRLGEIANEYVKPGALVMVEGTVVADENGNPRVWKSNSGEAKSGFELNVSTLRLLGGKRDVEGF